MGSLSETGEREIIKKDEEGKQSTVMVDTIATDQKPDSEFGEMGFLDEVAKVEEGGGAGDMWPATWPEKLGDYWWSYEVEEELRKGEIWYPYFDPELLNFRVYEENLEVDWEYELWDFDEFNEVPKA